MVYTLNRAKAMLVLATAVLAMCVTFMLASSQEASADSPYCGTTLGAHLTCYGGARWINALAGSGLNHSVCIGTTNYTGTTCSGGPNQSTYNPLGPDEYGQPWISNQGWSANQVGGWVYGG